MKVTLWTGTPTRALASSAVKLAPSITSATGGTSGGAEVSLTPTWPPTKRGESAGGGEVLAAAAGAADEAGELGGWMVRQPRCRQRAHRGDGNRDGGAGGGQPVPGDSRAGEHARAPGRHQAGHQARPQACPYPGILVG